MAAPLTVFITGASRGLGLEFVRQLVSRRTPPKLIFAACRNPSAADDLQKLALTNKCIRLLSLDVTKDDGIDTAVKETTQLLGNDGLNLLINNAGLNEKSGGGFLEKQTREKMQTHFDVNVTAPVLLTQKLLPLLKKAAEVNTSQPMSSQRAAIINISSIMGSISLSLASNGNAYHYRTSKAALNMATVLMAAELRNCGIAVTALHPGWVRTDMGGANADLTVSDSVSGCLEVINSLTLESSGALLDYTGKKIPW